MNWPKLVQEDADFKEVQVVKEYNHDIEKEISIF